MAFITIQEVRDQTTFSEISSLTDPQIDRYINLANAYLRRETLMNYRDATDPDLLTDLQRVTLLLVEYLWWQDQPEVKEGNFAGIASERIGSYSYNKGSNGEGTGNKELDNLLFSLSRKNVGLNLFSVSGPSRVTAKPYNPHAYVTDFEE